MSSGFNGQSFRFRGYLPKDKAERNECFVSMQKTIKSTRETQIFIETPYRNNDLLTHLVQTLDTDIMLNLSIDLTTTSEQIISQSIGDWRKKGLPDINKKLCIFLLN
jgi:16S rRNA (cytidine1402-2'-O)-methyltransferase